MTISLCMICRDNEDTIETALKSAVGVFDEIIVVDTGSKDRTLEIVHRYTKKIARVPWEDNFAKARNYGLDCSKSDLNFWMDSDDELPDETRFAIRSIAKDNNPKAAYMFKIHNIINEDFAKSWMNDYLHLKLFPNRKDIRFGNTFMGNMHEGVVEDILKLPIEIRAVDFEIIHHGYETIDKLESKLQRNIRIGMNREGFYYQFRINENFFVFVENELSIWKPNHNNCELAKANWTFIPFLSRENMAEGEILFIIKKANDMIVENKIDLLEVELAIAELNNKKFQLQEVSFERK